MGAHSSLVPREITYIHFTCAKGSTYFARAMLDHFPLTVVWLALALLVKEE